MKENKRFVRGNMILIYFLSLTLAVTAFPGVLYAASKTKPAAPGGLLANGVKGDIVLSWEPVNKADGYEVYEKKEKELNFYRIKVTSSCKLVLTNRERGKEYEFKVRAYRAGKGKTIYGKFSKKGTTTVAQNGTSTIRNFLTTALAPVGSTMYIWGGGWNEENTGAGKDGRRIGLNPAWRKFAKKQKPGYNYKKYRYMRGYGLDCSGYVGWCVYNTRKIKNGKSKEGYVIKSGEMARSLAEKGLGTYKSASKVKDWKAGDIMSYPTHVYIVVGSCKDGSVVLIHSSKKGVTLCGTPGRTGKKKSQAVKLAQYYMKRYYPGWYRRFGDCERGKDYLTCSAQFRWSTEAGREMSDPDRFLSKSAEHILKELFQ